MVGQLAALRRFPVASLGGESPNEVRLADGGMIGERAFRIMDAETARPMDPALLEEGLQFQARFLDASVVGDLDSWARVRSPDGTESPLRDEAWQAELSRRVGRRVRVAPADTTTQARELHLLSRPTLGFLERAYGRALESARIRANFVVDLHGGKVFGEDAWLGKHIRVGDGLFEVVGPSRGCLLTEAGPPAAGDLGMIGGLLHVRAGELGVRLRAVSGLRVRVGDPVALVG